LNCGEGVAGDISRWSPGVNVGKSMDFVDSCYLIKHGQGWLLWDTGLADAIAAMPEGQRPADPRMTHWRRPKTLAAQLDQLGVKPSDIKYVAVSHTHPDHIGNMTLFPQSMLLVQKAEYEWPAPPGHQSLLVKLPKTGAVLLSGDAVHFKENWENRRVPEGNDSKDKTAASMQRMADLMAKEKAQLWINHDKAQRDGQKMSPEYYE
jgi:glyoxylase-like metal-dependent hydrolase (beta-lactamase superfamily II)